jgi:hypothetical protein
MRAQPRRRRIGGKGIGSLGQNDDLPDCGMIEQRAPGG